MKLQGWLLDTYRTNDCIVLWVKTTEGNVRITQPFQATFYIDASACLEFPIVERFTYMRAWKKVHKITISGMNGFERFVSRLENHTKHRIPIYNADVQPEQQFLYENNLSPGGGIEIEDNQIRPVPMPEITLTKATMSVVFSGKSIVEVKFNNAIIEGTEENMLKRFLELFIAADPDVVLIDYAFSVLPLVEARLAHYGLHSPFHRWDSEPIKYRGGKSFFSYGQVIFRDYAIRLRGRFLVDTCTTIGGECDVDGILELCRLTGARFQQVASRSFGAIFQFSLMRLMYQKGYLIPYKEKPVDIPLSMLDLLKADSAGHRLDPKVGFHRDVAEIDFTSMFPWIIYNRNISAETMLCQDEPLERIPGLNLTVSHAYRGLVPRAIKPLLDKRMEYKKNPTALNLRRAKALKFVLVTAYGYLRYREFKLGIASSQMAICAYAREILLQSARLAEERGFEVIHGIVDSLFIRKHSIKEDEVKDFCKELEQLVGIPVGLEGIFKWIVFLPSINDINRPLPATYYGAFRSGSVKARGIEVRQRKSPLIVKEFQQSVLDEMAKCSSKREVISLVPGFCRSLRERLEKPLHPLQLIHYLRIATTNYKHNIPQKRIVQRLKERGINVLPGQFIEYIQQRGKPVLPDEYNGKPDIEHYHKLLTRSLFGIMQPLGVKKEEIAELSGSERQTRLCDYQHLLQLMIPFEQSLARPGLSESLVRKRLEKQGWTVWRGDMLNILRVSGRWSVVNGELLTTNYSQQTTDLYPNVRRKYELLGELMEKHHPGKIEWLQYLCAVHHGIPDFICYRKHFKFVECKFGYEQLRPGQKKCIMLLQDAGFAVEIHRLAEPQTKARRVVINLHEGTRQVLEVQHALDA